MKQAAFPLNDEDLDMDMNRDGAPMDGMRYLASVMRQAKSMPKVTRVAASSSSVARQTVFIHSDAANVGTLVAVDGNETAWIEAYQAQYLRLRERMEPVVQQNRRARQSLPASLNDRIYWKRFVREREPTLDTVGCFDDVAVSTFIENVRIWLCDENPAMQVSERLCCWLFAVVSMMREPLDPDTQSDIQAVARAINNVVTQDSHLFACIRVVLAAIVTLESAARW